MSYDTAKEIRALYAIVKRLEEHWPGRSFTPDGHLIGSIGEVIAAEHYGLTLLRASYPVHDATAADGRMVQIKATQTDRIGISGEPEHLIVLRILPDGGWEEVYNGPGAAPWCCVCGRKRPPNGQYQLSLARLRALMEQVPPEDRLPAVQRKA